MRNVRAQYDQQNEQAAVLILRDVAKYGGEESGVVPWARLCLQRIARQEAESAGRLSAAGGAVASVEGTR